MKYYIKFLGVGIFCGIFCMLGYAIRYDEFICSDIIKLFGMGEVRYFMQYLSGIAYWFMPLLFFQIFFGTYIYRHFCTASIYFFSRCTKRNEWLIKEVLRLYIFVILYLFAMIGSGIFICSLISEVVFDINTVKILLYYIWIYSFYLFVTTLKINLIAIVMNSNIAFIIVEGINLFFIALFTITGEFFAPEGIIMKQYEWVLKVNPIYYLIFDMNREQQEYLTSAMIYMIMAVILLCCGFIIINKHNFIDNNKEMGGI